MSTYRNGFSAFVQTSLPLVLLLGVAAGCGEKDQAQAPDVEEQQEAKKQESAPAHAATDTARAEAEDEGERLAYSYNPIGKRDPFRSFITKDTVTIENRPETPLQKYEIDQFTLVAVIWGIDDPVAMVEDPEGMGHFLRKNTLIGKNWGKVVRISPTEVIVAEEYRDFEGKLIVNEIPLKLPAEQYEQ